MTDSRELMHDLLTKVVQVSSRTRELAVSEADQPLALLPLRQSIDAVLLALQALEHSLGQQHDVSSLIQDGAADEADASWLMGPGGPD